MKKEYKVTFRGKARCYVRVRAESPEEAQAWAEELKERGLAYGEEWDYDDEIEVTEVAE